MKRLILGCAIVAGLVGAHVLGYAIAVPDPHLRWQVLNATGHGYFGIAAVVAVAGAAAAVAGTAVLGFRSPSALAWSTTAVKLSVAQIAAFLSLEAVERAAAAHPIGIAATILVVGIGVQLVGAALGAAVLVLVAKTGAALARASAAVRGTASTVHRLAFREEVARNASFRYRFSARGPPILL